MLSELLEVAMIAAFGSAWPVSILKTRRMRTTKGKSISFLWIVLIGYICGIASKLVAGHVNYVVIFYLVNLLFVSIDIGFYFRNKRLDRLAAAA